MDWERGDLRPELLAYLVEADVAVFYDVMQEGRGDRHRIRVDLAENGRHGDAVRDVILATRPLLARVLFLAVLKGESQQLEVQPFLRAGDRCQKLRGEDGPGSALLELFDGGGFGATWHKFSR